MLLDNSDADSHERRNNVLRVSQTSIDHQGYGRLTPTSILIVCYLTNVLTFLVSTSALYYWDRLVLTVLQCDSTARYPGPHNDHRFDWGTHVSPIFTAWVPEHPRHIDERVSAIFARRITESIRAGESLAYSFTGYPRLWSLG